MRVQERSKISTDRGKQGNESEIMAVRWKEVDKGKMDNGAGKQQSIGDKEE